MSHIELSPDYGGETSTYWAYYAPTYEGEPYDLGPLRPLLERLRAREERENAKLRAQWGPVQQFSNPLAMVLDQCRCDGGELCALCDTLNNGAP